MQINKISTSYDAYANVGHARKAAHKDDTASRDEITMSNRAKEYQHAKSALSSVPDVRHEKVSAVKSGVENGSYKVPANDIANKIMADRFV